MNQSLIKKALIIGITAPFLGCSSYQRPESIDSKIGRFKAQNKKTNPVPVISVFSEDRVFKKQGRFPASAAPVDQSSQYNIPKNNKKLYFLSLYGQYSALRQLIPNEEGRDINICPSFHTSLLTHKEQFSEKRIHTPNFQKRYQKLSENSLIAYPELSLPMTRDSQHPRVVDILRNQELTRKMGGTNQVIYQALRVHISQTKDELNQLCESGQSQNYYNYENLTTHIKRNQREFKASAQSMKTLFKTTLFSNMALIDSLKKKKSISRGPASAKSSPLSIYKSTLIEKLNVQWAENYFKAVDQLR